MAQTTTSAPAASTGFATSEATDPYIWLEDVEGDRAMEWVRAHNAHSLGLLQGDPRYETLHQQALEIVQSQDRIPSPGFTHDGHIDNFWQDAQHVRGRMAPHDAGQLPHRDAAVGDDPGLRRPGGRPRARTGSIRARPASSPRSATA